jgi:hypothetical protein
VLRESGWDIIFARIRSPHLQAFIDWSEPLAPRPALPTRHPLIGRTFFIGYRFDFLSLNSEKETKRNFLSLTSEKETKRMVFFIV